MIVPVTTEWSPIDLTTDTGGGVSSVILSTPSANGDVVVQVKVPGLNRTADPADVITLAAAQGHAVRVGLNGLKEIRARMAPASGDGATASLVVNKGAVLEGNWAAS